MSNIVGYVGPNGSGKTLAVMAQRVLPAWDKGRVVVSNMPLRPEAIGYPADLYQPLETISEILEVNRALLVLDEITGCFPSRQFNTLPPEMARFLNQLRKRDVQMVWTAPHWRRADTIIREVTQTVTLCKGFWSDRFERQEQRRRFPRALRDEQRRRIRVGEEWLPNRVFLWRTYDAQEFEEFSLDKARQGTSLRPASKRWYWRSRHLAHRAYDTLAQTSLLDHLDDFGRCMTCRGTRTPPKCECGKRKRQGPEGAAMAAPEVPRIDSAAQLEALGARA